MSIFGKKNKAKAYAVTLEDGRAISNRETTKLKVRDEYGFYNEPKIEILVRVEPQNDPPFEAKLKA